MLVQNRMQPIPIPYMPVTVPPCFSARSRREANTVDTTNARMVELWQTDSPSLIHAARVDGVDRYNDMNPIPSRLYREDMRQSQPYVVPTADSEYVKKEVWFDNQISHTLGKIQDLTNRVAASDDEEEKEFLKGELSTNKEIYRLLLAQQKQLQLDLMSQNPYFEKYDIPGDSRNIVRELRASVSEDVVDRGIVESQKLLKREFESRWLPANFAETQRLDSLSAYELMRPKFNNQERTYQ